MAAVVGLPVVEHCMSGLNASVFAYGQTGAPPVYLYWCSDTVGILRQCKPLDVALVCQLPL